MSRQSVIKVLEQYYWSPEFRQLLKTRPEQVLASYDLTPVEAASLRSYPFCCQDVMDGLRGQGLGRGGC